MKYTIESTTEKSKQYKYKSDFKKANRGYFEYAYRNNMLDVLFPKKVMNINIAIEKALLCTTRKQFQKDHGDAFWYAKQKDILDEVCAHISIRRRWTKETSFREALKYKTRIEMKQKDRGLSGYLYENKYIDEACSHMSKGIRPVVWTYEKLKNEAIKHSTTSELKSSSLSVYQIIRRKKYLELLEHMEVSNPVCDYNTVYIWEAVGEKWNDLPIFKIGVTSARLGIQRIKRVAKEMGFEYNIHLNGYFDNASEIEAEIHRELKVIPKLSGDGFSEFRACSYEEIANIIDRYEL